MSEIFRIFHQTSLSHKKVIGGRRYCRRVTCPGRPRHRGQQKHHPHRLPGEI